MSVLVVCTEVGSAVALKEILILEKVNTFYFDGSKLAKEFFNRTCAFNIIDNENNLSSKLINKIYLGSTLGPCAETLTYESKRFSSVEKTSVIDSYWNISQRFADTKTGKKWKFCPNSIYVPNDLIAKKLKTEGYKGKVKLFSSPSFNGNYESHELVERSYIRNKYKVQPNHKAYIFISEYSQKIPSSWNIEADQFNYDEIRSSLELFNKRVNYLNKNGSNVMPFIKWHPTLYDKANLEQYLHKDIVQIQSIEKLDLFKLGDVFFGLNSMLFLEAFKRGLNAVSLMTDDMKRKNNLSNYYKDITWKNNYTF